MAYKIVYSDTGESFETSGKETLFAGMIRTGIGPKTHGCQGGGCGVCKVKILSGTFDRIKNMSRKKISEEEIAEGFVLACCIKPTGDIEFSKN